jgi:hypothetical protein
MALKKSQKSLKKWGKQLLKKMPRNLNQKEDVTYLKVLEQK